MSPENLKALVQAETERGDAAFAAAEKLIEAALYYDAASRAYYAAFHYARALCLVAGDEPRSHRGVAHLLNVNYVRPGHLMADTSRIYAVLQQFRESADYDASFVFDAAGGLEALDKAREFLRRARALL